MPSAVHSTLTPMPALARGIGRVCLALMVTLLSACGGGGSSPPPPPSTVFDLASAVTGIATANETFTLAGSLAGQPTTLVAAHQALPDAPFRNFGTLNSFRRTATLAAGGRSSGSSYEDDYVDLAGRTFYGLRDDQGNVAVSTVRTPYPATATIGASGHLFDANHFDAAGSPIGGATSGWSLEPVAGDADSAYLCLNTVFLDTNGQSTGDLESDCYRIRPTGERLGMRVTLTSPAFGTVTFE